MTNHIAQIATSATISTFCVGRFLIEAPSGSKLSGGNYKYDFASIAPSKPMAFEEFEKEVAKHESKLNSARNNRTKQSMLLRSVQPDKNTRILASWEVEASTAQIKISGYRWIDSSQFLLEDIVDDDKRDLGIEGMRDTLLHLRPRADTEIPTDPGYCFAGGFIANPRWRNEEAGVDIDIAGHPDAFVSVWIYPLASHKKDRPLLERMGGIAQALGNLATSVHVLRKGDRQIGPYKGQEHLASAPNSGGMRGHAFVWETQGDGTLDTPAIKIELTTGHQDSNGNPQQTTLTDQQAIKLWDDILNSFRLRPTGPVKTSALAPEPQPLLPLGELVATGRACPQTGWWQTVEAGEIAGGRRKRFTAGDQMPDVVLLGASSVWQKLKGERPSHRTATLWKLVDYDEADTNPAVAKAGHNVNADARRDG
ncbi:T6SS immunity protein Tli4 family protein [Pseudoduganella rivuli]|uniref:T6SS immunity protein Tli4 family protein n=1 Tax=Pseudoduganella rivuli TaxID=2666085 RepID=UPI001E57DF21|nr:T6SS immunity protein Tli4 family protein [Pseudoduganella rivuli]